jgi:polyisoprenoid-binding protein YceI
MKQFAPIVAVLAAVLTLAAADARAADNYKADPVHSSILFRSKHANLGHVWGRFNDVGGTFALDDADPTKATFNIEVKAASVDTNQPKRDEHLRSPDFLNAKQYPTITFKSTGAKKGAADKTLEVTGDLTLHGVTKPVTATIELIGKGEFPPGAQRAGIEATFSVKKSEFGFKNMPGVDDEIRLVAALEGVKQ